MVDDEMVDDEMDGDEISISPIFDIFKISQANSKR